MLTTAEGEKVGESKIAARQGISMVVMSRVFMAAPGRSGPWLWQYWIERTREVRPELSLDVRDTFLV